MTASDAPTAERAPEVDREHGSRLASPTALEESLLIERARTDRRAFAPLYLAHYPAIVLHIDRRLGDAHAAQDVAAETFIRAMNAIEKYKDCGLSLRHWLLRIATNEVNRHLKRSMRRRARERVAVKRELVEATGANETAEQVRRALSALSAEHQTVLALHYFESLSVEEIARVVGWRVGTVKSRMSRARAALGAMLTTEAGCGSEGRP